MTDDTALSVLLIEDNPADARIVREQYKTAKETGLFERVLHKSEFESIQFTHEEDLDRGTERLREGTYDAVLLDLQLPDSEGAETVDAVVDIDPNVPVVVLTGMPEQRLGGEAISRGAQDYLVKGKLTPELLFLTLQYAIERKKRERILRRRSNRLAILNRLTRHDVRNDVSLIVGRASELTDHVDPRGQSILEEIRQSGNHILELTDMIGEALDAMADGQDPLGDVDLEALLGNEVEKATRLHGGAEVTLGSVPEASVKANELLSSVVANLINNGVVYNDKETPTVRVDAVAEGDTVTIRVADNGTGIPKHRREAVFSERTNGAESAGLGVGLTLAHRLVTQFGGEMSIEDNDPDGTVFLVSLQRAEAPAGLV